MLRRTVSASGRNCNDYNRYRVIGRDSHPDADRLAGCGTVSSRREVARVKEVENPEL